MFTPKALSAALTLALVSGAAAVQAEENPFAIKKLENGYQLAAKDDATKSGEKACGGEKGCGGDKMKEKDKATAEEKAPADKSTKDKKDDKESKGGEKACGGEKGCGGKMKN